MTQMTNTGRPRPRPRSINTTQINSHLLQILQQTDPITSTKSKTVKLYQQLAAKSKYRSKNQLTVLEGHRLIIDTLANKHTRKLYRDILVTEEALLHPQLGTQLSLEIERIINEQDLEQDQDDATVNKCRVRLASQGAVKAACDTVTPQGVVALLDIPPPYQIDMDMNADMNADMKMDHQEEKQKAKLFLLLDGISDPGNVGTLLRSAKAIGAECVLLLPGSCDVWNPKAIRSAMGTSFTVPIRSIKSWKDCLDFMDSCGVDPECIYAATMEGSEGLVASKESKAHFHVDWMSHSNALILGKEGSGLSEQVRDSVARGQIRSVHVPMEEGVESLNVGTCGSVVMFEYHRQLQLQQQQQQQLLKGQE